MSQFFRSYTSLWRWTFDLILPKIVELSIIHSNQNYVLRWQNGSKSDFWPHLVQSELSLWSWKRFPFYPLTWWIFTAGFVEMPPLNKEILCYTNIVNGQKWQSNRQLENTVSPHTHGGWRYKNMHNKNFCTTVANKNSLAANSREDIWIITAQVHRHEWLLEQCWLVTGCKMLVINCTSVTWVE